MICRSFGFPEMTVGKFLAVVTDIEGTTTPISFVHDELFPYVLTNLTAFLESHWEDAQVQFVIEKLATLVSII